METYEEAVAEVAKLRADIAALSEEIEDVVRRSNFSLDAMRAVRDVAIKEKETALKALAEKHMRALNNVVDGYSYEIGVLKRERRKCRSNDLALIRRTVECTIAAMRGASEELHVFIDGRKIEEAISRRSGGTASQKNGI